jgi:site-specific DNA recombinase
MLNAEGYTTKEGKPFHPMQVKRMLDRKEFYEGIYRYSGVEAEGQHQAIL